MGQKKKKKQTSPVEGVKIVTRNRKARYLYAISDTFEAGMVLQGTEVKSLRAGRVNIGDAYARIKNGELWLMNCHIDEYTEGNRYNHDPMRPRKLLMHAREIKKLTGKLAEQGFTLVVMAIYFKRNRAKVELGLGKGKKLVDRREDIKRRDAKRAMAREMR